MIEIGKTVVSFDIFDHKFCCNLEACCGQCCVEGDSGAPLTKDEVVKLNEVLPKVRSYLLPKSLEVIDRQGVSYVDADGDDVTSLVDNRECVFAYFDDGICLCALEKAFNDGVIDFPKPISCHLYPVRITEYSDFTAVGIHRWSCCQSAEENGVKLGLPVYKFLKNPLIRRFGSDWYSELEHTAEAYYAEFKTINR